MSIKTKEIGSDYKISLSSLNLFTGRKITDHNLYLTSGRECLKYISKNVKNVLLPAYLCSSISNQFNKLESILFYHLDKNLNIDIKNVKYLIENNQIDMMLTINYFGKIDKNIDKIVKLCKLNDIIIVEDVTHSIFTTTFYGDIIFGSLRKTFPIPDGAFILPKYVNESTCKLNCMHTMHTMHTMQGKYYILFILSKFAGMLLKNLQFIKCIWRPILLFAESLLDKLDSKHNRSYTYPMSCISKIILSNIDDKKVKKQRLDNYTILNAQLSDLALFPKEQLYFGYPIVLKSKVERNALRENLIKHKIYPPVHWVLPKDVNSKEFFIEHNLSNCIMTIPIDQRYNKNDMNRIIRTIKEFMN